MITVSVERLQEIEQERVQTQSDIQFQTWMTELNVGRMYVDRQPILHAQDAMQDWDIGRLNVARITIQ